MPTPKNSLQKKWYVKLFPIHKHQWKRAYTKLRTKISNYKSVYGIDFEDMIFDVYGEKCPFCDTVLTVKTISVDHMKPQCRGGENIIENTEIICKGCNVKKGRLTRFEWLDFLMWINNRSEYVKSYFLMKLASKDWGKR